MNRTKEKIDIQNLKNITVQITNRDDQLIRATIWMTLASDPSYPSDEDWFPVGDSLRVPAFRSVGSLTTLSGKYISVITDLPDNREKCAVEIRVSGWPRGGA